MKGKYEISLNGCDDSTTFNMMLDIDEYLLIDKMCKLSEKTSNYGCMPTMEITNLTSSGA